jgi:gluconolactonase
LESSRSPGNRKGIPISASNYLIFIRKEVFMDITEIHTLGRGLFRPEGVMCRDDGMVFAADVRGMCAQINRDGETVFFGDVGGIPNGICMDPAGNCIIANIGNGQIQRLFPNGRHDVIAAEAGGRPIPSPNFPFMDAKGRLWVSNSTYREDLDAAIQNPAPDGSIVLIEKGEARIVAEGVFFANGLALDAEERFVYVAETTKRAITRFRIADDGMLTDRELYGPPVLGPLGFPDGIAFDEAGNLWITFPAWNALGFLTPRRELRIVLEDPRGAILRRPSNICFGWDDRKTAFVGSLDGDTIPFFQVPHPGVRLVHQR